VPVPVTERPVLLLALVTGQALLCQLASLALGLSGALMQALTRGPLADPGLRQTGRQLR
jgi:ABC-type Fe3+-siderophore transport system permease subunit